MRARVAAEEAVCWLCGAVIDYALPAGHPWAFEVDHVVPASLGGPSRDRNNYRASHRVCNQQRGNGPARPLEPPRSRDW